MFGVFLAVVIGKWAGVVGATAGLKIGAVTGLLLGFAFDLTLFGTTNISNINGDARRSVRDGGAAGSSAARPSGGCWAK